MPEPQMRYPFADAKNRLSALTAQANATGTPFVVTKNGKPWVEIRPLATRRTRSKTASDSAGGTAGTTRTADTADTSIHALTITPVRRKVEIPDVGALLTDYNGDFEPREDGFASPAGMETI